MMASDSEYIAETLAIESEFEGSDLEAVAANHD